MENKLKFILTLFILVISLNSYINLHAATCPPVDTISRIDGEYQWQSTLPGWSGYFVAPVTGKGRSYQVKKFIAASWVKSHDSANSAGFVQCDYIGNFGYEDNQANQDPSQPYEVIRFIQDNAFGARQPDTKISWTCAAITKYPSVACNCYTDLAQCRFSMG